MTSFPSPGKPVRGSKTGKPIMALFDLLGRNWAMGILWQLSEASPCTFRQIQSRCEGVSPTTLNARLKELRQAGFIERGDNGYCPSELGRELYQLLQPFSQFSRDWADLINPQDQQPSSTTTPFSKQPPRPSANNK